MESEQRSDVTVSTFSEFQTSYACELMHSDYQTPQNSRSTILILKLQCKQWSVAQAYGRWHVVFMVFSMQSAYS